MRSLRRFLVASLLLALLVESRHNGGAKRLGKKAVKKKSGLKKRNIVIEASSVAEEAKIQESEEKASVDAKIDIIRMKARKFLGKQDYNKAANCYAGILQLNEGKGGFKAGELRRRCCLTLAECEIKVGKLEHAISLCTEVIDEMSAYLDKINQNTTGSSIPSESSENDSEKQLNEIELKEYLGKAYYRRGVSLARLDHYDIAMLDLQEAHLLSPEDEVILDRIVAVQGGIDDRIRVEEEDEDEEKEGVVGDGSSLSSSSLSPAELKEKLLDVIEQAQLAEARYLSEGALEVLSTEERSVGPPLSPLSASGLGAGGAGGLGDILGAMGGMGGVGAGGGAPGLGALMGGLGGTSAGGKLPSLDSVANMLPMLGGMAGLSPDTIASGKEVLSAISHVGKAFFGIYKKVAPYKDLFFAVVAGVLIFISTRGGGRD